MSAPIDGTYAPVSSMDVENRHSALDSWTDSRRAEHRPVHTGSQYTVPTTAIASVAIALLGQMDQALLMVDRRHAICYQNDAAGHLLAGRSDIQIHSDRLAFTSKDEQHSFERMLDSLPWGRDEDAASNQVFRLGDADNALIIVGRAIDSGNQMGERTALLVLHRAVEPNTPHVPGLLRQAFGLTRAEAVVATMIAGGHTPAEIATHRNVSVETIRAQLRVLYAKTGTNRQAELVRLVHRVTYLT